MYQTGADFTNSFRGLSKFHSEADMDSALNHLLEQCCSAREYKSAFSPKMDATQLQMLMMLRSTNPDLLAMLGKKGAAIDRELALAEKAENLDALTEEVKREKDGQLWRGWLMRYKDRVASESNGASSEEFRRRRVDMMDAANPRIVLRNFVAQNAIEYAERGDFSEVQRVFRAMRKPFDATMKYADLTGFDEAVEGKEANQPVEDEDAKKTHVGPSCSRPRGVRIEYDAKPPEATSIRVSCSS